MELNNEEKKFNKIIKISKVDKLKNDLPKPTLLKVENNSIKKKKRKKLCYQDL